MGTLTKVFALSDLFWLAAHEGREHREDQYIRVFRDGEHSEQKEDAGEGMCSSIVSSLALSTHAKQSCAVHILLGQDDLKIALEEYEHGSVIRNIKVAELLGMSIHKAILSEDLDNYVPSPCHLVLNGIRVERCTVPPSPFPKPLADIIRKRCLGVGVHRGH